MKTIKTLAGFKKRYYKEGLNLIEVSENDWAAYVSFIRGAKINSSLTFKGIPVIKKVEK